MKPADRLILSLLPPPAGRENTLRQLATTPGFNWKRFEKHSIDWGLAPLMSLRLTQSGMQDFVPAPLLHHLAEIRRLTAVRNTVMDVALEKILSAFAENTIPVILLKGADLTRTVYPDPGIRISLDLDLLVRREEFPRAEEICHGLGYAPVSLGAAWHEEHLHHGVPLKSADGSITIELHWDLVRKSDPFRFDLPLLWQHSLPIRVRGTEARRLAAPDNAEYLAVHFFRHLTSPDGAIRSLADLVLLLESAEGRRIDWDALAAASREHGTVLPLALALAVIRRYWLESGLDGPATLLEQNIPDPRLLARACAIAGRLGDFPPHQPPAIVSGFTSLGQEKGAAAKLRFLRRGLLPGRTDVHPDLSVDQVRLPVVLRYAALFRNYVSELSRVGVRAAVAAYHAGTIRERLSASTPEVHTSSDGERPVL